MPTEDILKPVSEWHSVRGYHTLTRDQKKRLKAGKSIYERDKVVEPYTVNKGEFVECSSRKT